MAIVGRGAENVGYLERTFNEALDYNSVSLIKIILHQGFDYNRPFRPNRRYPLQQAIIRRRPLIVRALLEAGANPNIQNNRGDTALMVAIYEDPSLIKLLIGFGADPTILNNNNDNAFSLLEKQRQFIDDDRYNELLDILASAFEHKEPDYY